jgi:hypothetical protein
MLLYIKSNQPEILCYHGVGLNFMPTLAVSNTILKPGLLTLLKSCNIFLSIVTGNSQ